MKRLTTLTGPSCSGKSTLENLLAEQGCLGAISTTTRAPRTGEVHGQDYYFVDQAEFARQMRAGAFVECVQFGENHYGLTAAELERLFQMGDHVVLVCEPVGAKQIRRAFIAREDVELCQVFIDCPQQLLAERFLHRFFDDATAAVAAKGTPGLQATVQGYAKRQRMMAAEQEWTAEAYGPAHPDSQGGISGFRYDLIIPSFAKNNETDVVAQLVSRGRVTAP